MADQEKPLRRGAVLDQDTSDAFLDGPQPLYHFPGGGEPREITWDDIDRRLKAGLKGPALPTDWSGYD